MLRNSSIICSSDPYLLGVTVRLVGQTDSTCREGAAKVDKTAHEHERIQCR